MKRMVLAKFFYENGIIATANCNDSLRFAQGIIAFHDSVDLSLGAVADLLNIQPNNNNYLMQYMDLIPKNSDGRKVPYSQQLKTLNTLRNDIKHHGILPDPEANKHFPITITNYFIELCERFFDLDFKDINLIELINAQELKKTLNEAETAMKEHQFKQSLEILSSVLYILLEKDFLQSRYTFDDLKRERKIVYPEWNNIGLTVTLLEHGIDLKHYKRLHDLIPYTGFNYETEKTVVWWPTIYSHPGNWTEDNVLTCLNFVIDLVLKYEKPDSIHLKHYSEVFIDIVEPLQDNTTIWACPGVSIANGYMTKTLNKGQQICGIVYDKPEDDDYWIIEEIDQSFTGRVPKSEVQVRRYLKSDYLGVKARNNSEIIKE